MKKTLFSAVALLSLLTFTANAQVTTSGGLKTQANYSKYRLSGLAGEKSSFGVGASAGGFVKIEFSEYFAIQPELLFDLNRSKLKGAQNIKMRYMGVELPVYALGQVPLSSGKLFFGAGPYAAYGLSSKGKSGGVTSNFYKKGEGGAKASMSRFDYGVGGLVGYEFAGGFMINAGYQLGLKDVYKPSGSMKKSSMSLGVGYKF